MTQAYAAYDVRQLDDRGACFVRRCAATGVRDALGRSSERRESERRGLAREVGGALARLVEMSRDLEVLDRVDHLAESDYEAIESRERLVVEEQRPDRGVGCVGHDRSYRMACTGSEPCDLAYDAPMPSPRRPSNWAVLFAYVAPYFAYVLVLSIPDSLLPRPALYAIATVASAVALARGWRWYLPLRGPGHPAVSVAVGIAAGLFGTALWVWIKAPFYESGGEAWEPAKFWGRVIASSTVVPVFEELLFRGLVLLGAVQWDQARRERAKDPLGVALHDRSVLDLPLGSWTPAAVLVSTLAFAAGHAPGEWLAASAYGLLMAALWIGRKDLLSCVVAHGVTNASLAWWVQRSGQWSLW